MRMTAFVGFVLVMLIGMSCGRTDPLGPPSIVLDQSACAECGMIVSDERYACASIVQDESRGPVALVFDDINCLVGHEVNTRERPEVLARWVHDHGTLGWVAADQAHFVWAKELNTPMMSHIAAFADADAADAFREQIGGDAMSLAEVRDHFIPDRLRDSKPEGQPSPG